MTVTDSGAAVEEEEGRVVFIPPQDVNFLRQAPQGNFALFIDFHIYPS
jgi:hypothetical protein